MQTHIPAPLPDNEERRLATLNEYALLDSPTEALFNSLAAFAAQLCGTPIALITLIDRNRQWFKANVGLGDLREVARDIAFCAHTILNDDITEIHDMSEDMRFMNNPLVQNDPHLRFYAGVPLVVADGHTLGTLCVIDRQPRTLSSDQRSELIAIAAVIVHQFESRRADLQVRASEAAVAQERLEMFSAAIDSSQDAIMIATPGDGVGDAGTIIFANQALLAATRAKREDVIGQPANIFFGPKTDRDAIALMRRTLQGSPTYRMQYIAYRRDGSQYHCETTARALVGTQGTIAHIVYVQRDVSEPVTRGMSLELLNERLTTLTEVARSLFASLDPRALVDALLRGVTELTNGGTAQVLARGTGAEFIQTHDLTSRAETAVANDDFLRAAAAHEGALLSMDGRRAGVPILAPSGIVSYLLDIRSGERVFVATDAFAFGLLGQYLAVAVRNVELYRELASRRAAVIELNQVKNDLIAMLAHDFKGPLTTIVGLADVLAEDERFDVESRQLLGMINSSAMRLASLASDTLALSRLEQNELSLRFDRVDMVRLLRDIVRVFSVTRGIDMRSVSEVMLVRADAARLRQVFENLIGNAIKYSPRGETVDVMLREKGGGVEVSIRDRGIGIPAADRSKLFGRFARGSNAREMGIGGTGFGLYLSRTIIEMHGGEITIESKEGVGSTFRVLVPTVPAPQRTLDRRVLLLDSEDDGRSFIAHTLRDEGYAVYPVADESELLRALDDGRYDAAIVDVDRLVISPTELVGRIAHRTTLVRLVSTVESEGTGWNAALRKPFLIADLQVVLESAVAERRRLPRRNSTKD